MQLIHLRARVREWLLLIFLGVSGAAAHAATTTGPAAGLYSATVPLSDHSERGQAAAFQDAMRLVLARVTGRPDAGNEPALASLVGDAPRYVQQYQVLPDGQLAVGFDGAELEKLIVAADPRGAQEVTVGVTGIADLAAYAAVTEYLESLRWVRSLAVEELSGEAVIYRLRVLGGAAELVRAIELDNRLQPAPSADTAASGTTLGYRYRSSSGFSSSSSNSPSSSDSSSGASNGPSNGSPNGP
jgi:hypothetical protein